MIGALKLKILIMRSITDKDLLKIGAECHKNYF